MGNDEAEGAVATGIAELPAIKNRLSAYVAKYILQFYLSKIDKNAIELI